MKIKRFIEKYISKEISFVGPAAAAVVVRRIGVLLVAVYH